MQETYLDSLSLLEAQVGYGNLGMHGTLGYEGKTVSVRQRHYPHALSTHPPARLVFGVGKRFASFSCQVALNDDVPHGRSHADFVVTADGREVAVEPHVRAGDPPRTLVADISGAENLELIVRTSRWEYSHAVWLDPQLNKAPAVIGLSDCLGRSEMIVPGGLPCVERCIATVVSPRFVHLLDDMLGSLYANGGCQDAFLLVFVLDGNKACEQVISKYRAAAVQCIPRAQLNPASKAVLYSIARVINAKQYLCLDADMIVLGDLRPLFSALEACREGKILACSEGNSSDNHPLGWALRTIYGAGDNDLRQLEITPAEEAYSFIVNDGLFAGGRAAMLALDSVIRAMSQAASWVDGDARVSWRNQFIFNLALARLQCGIELDPAYNLQLHVQDVEIQPHGAGMHALWRGRPQRVLHFNGGAKLKHPEWRNRFAKVPDPLSSRGAGDAYSAFLDALRTWIGHYGVNALTWSFYGLTDGAGAAVRDPSTFPLLALLHYLIRSNGCARVLETGTARGVSAACLASSVSHRGGCRVVTLDPDAHAGREELWATLPAQFRDCIEPRAMNSLDGMKAALDAGELYEAVLLDSQHNEQHVWSEFQLAARLVCPGGLILIHDPTYAYGTVEQALRRIEASGYNVVRLWTAEGGIAEDDRLGLAVIENRPRPQLATASQRGSGNGTFPPAKVYEECR